MPKFFCDYCDVYLTHDSMSVRKAHNSGRNHLRNVVDYYQQIGHEKAQAVIDGITNSYAAEGQTMPTGPGMNFGAPGSAPPGFGPPNGMPPGFPPMPGAMPPGKRSPLYDHDGHGTDKVQVCRLFHQASLPCQVVEECLLFHQVSRHHLVAFLQASNPLLACRLSHQTVSQARLGHRQTTCLSHRLDSLRTCHQAFKCRVVRVLVLANISLHL
jgi:hypothetical protein